MKTRWILALSTAFLIRPAVNIFISLSNFSYSKDSAAFYEFYKKPELSASERPKYNLVMIYLEGFERTFFDEQRFPNLITGLKEFEKESMSFTNMEQTWGLEAIGNAVSMPSVGILLQNRRHNLQIDSKIN